MVNAYIASTSNNDEQYLIQNMGTRDMWRKPLSKQHASSPPELGKENAQGPVETMHEPIKINRWSKRYFVLAYEKLKCLSIKILRCNAIFKIHVFNHL